MALPPAPPAYWPKRPRSRRAWLKGLVAALLTTWTLLRDEQDLAAQASCSQWHRCGMWAGLPVLLSRRQRFRLPLGHSGRRCVVGLLLLQRETLARPLPRQMRSAGPATGLPQRLLL